MQSFIGQAYLEKLADAPKIEVNLVDPNSQYVPFRDAMGLPNYRQLTKSYNNLLQENKKKNLMYGNFKRTPGLAHLVKERYQPAPQGAENPADRFVKGDPSVADYDRKAYGPAVARILPSWFNDAINKQNNFVAQRTIKQNDAAAQNAHRAQVSNWIAQGMSGPRPQYQSASELLNQKHDV